LRGGRAVKKGDEVIVGGRSAARRFVVKRGIGVAVWKKKGLEDGRIENPENRVEQQTKIIQL